MWYIFLFIAITSCKVRKDYVQGLSKPSRTEFDQFRRVVKPSGQENRKRYLYYNSLQYKGKYKKDD
jgi:hypothetical protein